MERRRNPHQNMAHGGGHQSMARNGNEDIHDGNGEDEEISPYFNPFWNPKQPMPYPVNKQREETFPPMRQSQLLSPERGDGGGGVFSSL